MSNSVLTDLATKASRPIPPRIIRQETTVEKSVQVPYWNVILIPMAAGAAASPPATDLPVIGTDWESTFRDSDSTYEYCQSTAKGELLIDHASIRGDYLWEIVFDCSSNMRAYAHLVYGSPYRDPEIQLKVNGAMTSYTTTTNWLGIADIEIPLKQGRNKVILMQKNGSGSLNFLWKPFGAFASWVSPGD